MFLKTKLAKWYKIGGWGGKDEKMTILPGRSGNKYVDLF